MLVLNSVDECGRGKRRRRRAKKNKKAKRKEKKETEISFSSGSFTALSLPSLTPPKKYFFAHE
jgi:hypothetical protein